MLDQPVRLNGADCGPLDYLTKVFTPTPNPKVTLTLTLGPLDYLTKV